MSCPAAPEPDPKKVIRALRYRSHENHCRSEAALEADDLVTFQDKRHTARLERDAADEIEASRESQAEMEDE